MIFDVPVEAFLTNIDPVGSAHFRLCDEDGFHILEVFPEIYL